MEPEVLYKCSVGKKDVRIVRDSQGLLLSSTSDGKNWTSVRVDREMLDMMSLVITKCPVSRLL